MMPHPADRKPRIPLEPSVQPMNLSPLTFALLSLLIYALGSNLDWSLRGGHRPVSAPWSALRARIEQPQLRRRLRLTFLLGMTALALLLRIPSPEAIGLPAPALDAPDGASAWRPAGDLPFAQDLAWTLGLALVAALLILASHSWRRAAEGRGRGLSLSPTRPEIGPAALDALALESHWALMRAGIFGLAIERAGLGLFLALALIGLEAWTNPWLRAASQDVFAMARASQGALLCILSGCVFLVTGSSIWALVGHLSVAGAVMALQPAAWLGAGGVEAPELPLGDAASPELPPPEPREPEPIEPTVV